MLDNAYRIVARIFTKKGSFLSPPLSRFAKGQTNGVRMFLQCTVVKKKKVNMRQENPGKISHGINNNEIKKCSEYARGDEESYQRNLE